MKIRFTHIISIFCLALFAFVSCGQDEDTVPTERTNIEAYLKRLDMEFNNVDGVYKVVENRDREGRYEEPLALIGDSVEMIFEAYRFASDMVVIGISNRSTPFYTNNGVLIELLAELGLNSEYWTKDPMKVKLGRTEMTRGLQIGLPDSHMGDSILLFFPSSLGYGTEEMSTIPGNSPIAFRVYLEKVNKQ